MKEKVIIHGTGRSAEYFYKADFNTKLFTLLAFSDGNIEKQGGIFLGYPVIAPGEIKKYDYDAIIVASVFFDEIRENLINEFEIANKKIVNMYYRSLENIKKRYIDYYKKNQKISKDTLHKTLNDKDKIVVYTAITNNFDMLREPLWVDKRCKYVCFTDNPNLKSDNWEIVLLEEECRTDSNRIAKKLKILPHLYFKEYDWSVWLDGKFQITGNILELIDYHAINSNFLSFMHYARNKVYQEAEVCKKLELDDKNIIKMQIKGYQDDKFNDDNELIEGGILFRRHNDSKLIKVMELWWEEIVNKSKRDQLSFNYVAWKNKFFFDLLDMNCYDNLYVRKYPHNIT